MSSNPMFNNRILNDAIASDEPMTLQGVINKTIFLLLLVTMSGYFTWDLLAKGFADKAQLLAVAGVICGFILCLFTIFKPNTSKITAPAYALCEGLVLGSVSFAFESMLNGIVLNAVAITLIVLFVMLGLYKAKIITATEKFKKVVMVSTLAIAIFYFVGFIAALLNHPMTIFNGGIVGIVVSFVICVIAALNFIIDFDNIETSANSFAPKYFEWYFGFSLMLTLIWLYLELLRLLYLLNSRRD